MVCNDSNCKLILSRKVSKKMAWIALWGFLVAIGLPMLVTGIKVWSGQEGDPLRYVEKQEFAPVKERQAVICEKLNNIVFQIAEIKRGQNDTQKAIEKSNEETQRDIKEILLYLRDRNSTKRGRD